MKNANDHPKSHKKNYSQPSQAQHYPRQCQNFQMFNQGMPYITNSPGQVNKNISQDYSNGAYQYFNIQGQQSYNAAQKQYVSPEIKKRGKKNGTTNPPVPQQHIDIPQVYINQSSNSTSQSVGCTMAEVGSVNFHDPTRPFLCFNILKRGDLPGITFSVQV